MAEDKLALRNRIIGLLLRDAREHTGRTKQECADVLGTSSSTITAYEEGRKPISLPELEVLAYLLGTPLAHFLEQDPKLTVEIESLPLQEVLNLRHRIVGALLRQARLGAGMTQKELAEVMGCSPSRVSAYEYGKRPIPMAELELFSCYLFLRKSLFFDEQDGSIVEWHSRQTNQRLFSELPKEVQEFITQPINIKYLEVAMKLAQMPAGGLRAIAEGLLDITY